MKHGHVFLGAFVQYQRLALIYALIEFLFRFCRVVPGMLFSAPWRRSWLIFLDELRTQQFERVALVDNTASCRIKTSHAEDLVIAVPRGIGFSRQRPTERGLWASADEALPRGGGRRRRRRRSERGVSPIVSQRQRSCRVVFHRPTRRRLSRRLALGRAPTRRTATKPSVVPTLRLLLQSVDVLEKHRLVGGGNLKVVGALQRLLQSATASTNDATTSSARPPTRLGGTRQTLCTALLVSRSTLCVGAKQFEVV